MFNMNSKKVITDKYKNYLSFLILALITISMITSDWLYGPVAISELIMAFTLLVTIVFNMDLLKKIKWKLYIFGICFLIIQTIYQLALNQELILKLLLYSVVKIIFYSFFINMFYYYVKDNYLEKRFLTFLNIGAIIAILIGIYITFAIITESELPYKFFWEFTRTKRFSYEYKEYSNIIRTRSLFSEPAHLGYFLNFILGFNLFSNFKVKNYILFNILLLIGIFFTLSYASIGVTSIILFVKLMTVTKSSGYSITMKKIVVISIPLLLLIVIFREYLVVTIVERTISIFNGTDASAYNRLFSSWKYINLENLLFGNGVAHSPPITNNFAYFLSDFGIFIFSISIYLTYKLLQKNIGLGVLFILLNFQKGGYLSPVFTLFILGVLVYAFNKNSLDSKQLKKSYFTNIKDK